VKVYKFIAAFCLLFFICLQLNAQFDTKLLLPGKTFTNRTDDTLVITLKSRIDTALVKNRQLKIALKEIEKQEEIIRNLEQQNEIREEKIKLYKEIVGSFQRVEEACEEHAHEMKKEAKRQSRLKNLSLLGGGAAVIIMAILLI